MLIVETAAGRRVDGALVSAACDGDLHARADGSIVAPAALWPLRSDLVIVPDRVPAVEPPTGPVSWLAEGGAR